MPMRIQRKGKTFVLVDDAGKVFGTHDTASSARKQLAAIELSKRRRKGKRDG